MLEEEKKATTGRINKSTIMLVGSMGAGKSTIVNCLVGEDVALNNDGAISVTTNINKYDSRVHNGLTIIDTPGLGGPDIPVKKWIKMARTI